jgi:hypothetical protein
MTRGPEDAKSVGHNAFTVTYCNAMKCLPSQLLHGRNSACPATNEHICKIIIVITIILVMIINIIIIIIVVIVIIIIMSIISIISVSITLYSPWGHTGQRPWQSTPW